MTATLFRTFIATFVRLSATIGITLCPFVSAITGLSMSARIASWANYNTKYITVTKYFANYFVGVTRCKAGQNTPKMYLFTVPCSALSARSRELPPRDDVSSMTSRIVTNLLVTSRCPSADTSYGGEWARRAPQHSRGFSSCRWGMDGPILMMDERHNVDERRNYVL